VYAAEAAAPSKNLADQVREATESGNLAQKRLSLIVNGKGGKASTPPADDKAKTPESPPALATPAPKLITEKIIDLDVTVRAAPATKRPSVDTKTTRQRPAPAVKAQTVKAPAAKPPAAAHHVAPAAELSTPHQGDGHWSYAGETGPQAWSRLSKDFNVCAIGKRQSPINIEEASTLQGPAEPLQFNYQPSSGTVVNNGHTIQVDLTGDNAVTVRGSRYKLLQFHFHTPSEERVNGQGFAMVAHLVHKNEANQLAVVAVLLEPGVANSLIHQVWTYMPLDSGDRVSMPTGLIDMNALLPKDQRYYQFMGSLTTPPCTEGVLWMVMKQPSPISREQIKLFTQIFPNNSRPVQPLNGRSVRDAQ
jgi:carbonic anhydrase